ncbi:MAG TPA: 2Fe-2S iron-sulfur cluster-binding protein [Burkholderiaceae bacterium]|jgi:2Fe-2S ferredoxin|nr:2Fe-2S iron-sulfur cluster-binding protein [Burkholderiaceae bacterium]
MPTAHFTDSAGTVTTIEIKEGHSLMEGARMHGLDGIVAECGGGAICGTCHVQVGTEWFAQLPEPEASEAVLLEMVPERRDTSRLACQIVMHAGLDGIQVSIPSEQIGGAI